jgi:hypothetical protein
MQEDLVRFACARCGRQSLRYATRYRQMMHEHGQAWCIACAPPPYRGPSPSPELFAVGYALLARSHDLLARADATRAVCEPAGDRCGGHGDSDVAVVSAE